jgi:pimeloyl-ACP methyl ester carboxylesterase
MAILAFSRSGTGDPLVLLHGLGSSRGIWSPVLPELARSFDVIAVDLPGFGDSELLPPSVEATPATLAQQVAELLDELDIAAPHLVGNSLGGWVALELAGVRRTASVMLLSPAGLWRHGTPLYCRLSLQATGWLAAHAGRLLSLLVGSRAGRILVLGQVIGRPARVDGAEARDLIHTLATSRGFGATLRATLKRHYVSGAGISAPVSVAFGSRDRLLLRSQSRHLDELPRDTHLGTVPGCGHVPTVDDAPAVLAFIASSVARATGFVEDHHAGVAHRAPTAA